MQRKLRMLDNLEGLHEKMHGLDKLHAKIDDLSKVTNKNAMDKVHAVVLESTLEFSSLVRIAVLMRFLPTFESFTHHTPLVERRSRTRSICDSR
jgi:hypothetical protein